MLWIVLGTESIITLIGLWLATRNRVSIIWNIIGVILFCMGIYSIVEIIRFVIGVFMV